MQGAVARPVVLTIAGFDPSSGAGVTADLKTFAAHRLYGVAAITALTVQSTQGVRAVEPVAPVLLRETLVCLAEDVPLAGIKLGMLATAGLAEETDRFLRDRCHADPMPVVLDPVLRSSSGAALLTADGVALLRDRLLGRASWVTPNLDELSLLTEMDVQRREQVPAAAARLAELGEQAGNATLAVAVTGGHLDPPDDYVLVGGEGRWLPGARVETTSTHGTGCAFSSALLSALVRGASDVEAVAAAKQYVTRALRAAYPAGRGRGPLHHLFAYEEAPPGER